MKKLIILMASLLILTSAFLVLSCSSNPSVPGTPSATQPQPPAPSASAPAPAKTPVISPVSTISSSSPAPKRGGVLKYIASDPGGPIGWPPNIIGGASTTSQFAFEGLLRQQLDGSLIPWLATSYEVAPDKTAITFHLRQGVKFHDNTDFNAAAVKFNLDAQIATKRFAFWKSVDVLNDYTVTVNLNSWNNTLLAGFGDTAGAWTGSPTYFQKNGVDYNNYHECGTGPFKFVSYTKDSKIVYTRNDNYWQKDKPYLDGLQVDMIADQSTKFAAMTSGQEEVDEMDIGQKANDLNKLKQANFKVVTQHQATYSLIPDSANADSPFANPLVRQAVAYSIDKESMASGLGFGFLQAPYQLPPRDNAAYNPNFSLIQKYDPAKSKDLLARAGYPNGFNTTFVPSPSMRNDDADVAVQSFLKAVGINAEMKKLDPAAYSQYRDGGQWKNGLVLEPLATWANYNQTLNYYLGPASVQFKSWGRPDQFVKDLKTSMDALTPDQNLIRVAAEGLIKNNDIIPVWEGGLSYAFAPYVMDGGFCTRGFPIFFNAENIWLNK